MANVFDYIFNIYLGAQCKKNKVAAITLVGHCRRIRETTCEITVYVRHDVVEKIGVGTTESGDNITHTGVYAGKEFAGNRQNCFVFHCRDGLISMDAKLALERGRKGAIMSLSKAPQSVKFH